MCIAIPMQVVSSEEMRAVCRNGQGTETVSTELSGPVAPGDWVLVFQGAAQRKMEEDEALKMRTALFALSDVMEGTATSEEVDAAFADILAHTGELPEHLRKNA